MAAVISRAVCASAARESIKESVRHDGVWQGQGLDAQRRSDFSDGMGEGRDSWRYRFDNGRWWFWGPDNRWMWYTDDDQWQYYGNEYVVRRPILQTFSGDPIKIVNPSKSGATLTYTLDGQTFTIPPGYSQTFQAIEPG